jgi:hypothetical protein
MAAPILRLLKATTAILAFDADAASNHVVASCLARQARDLKEQGFSLELERWALSDGKGIDDLLAAGKQPQRLIDNCVANAIKEIVASAKKPMSSPVNRPWPIAPSMTRIGSLVGFIATSSTCP